MLFLKWNYSFYIPSPACAHICLCVYVHQYKCTCTHRMNLPIIPQMLSILICLLLLWNLVMLTGQYTPKIYLSWPHQHTHYKHYSPCLALFFLTCFLGTELSYSGLKGRHLLAVLSPHSPPLVDYKPCTYVMNCTYMYIPQISRALREFISSPSSLSIYLMI